MIVILVALGIMLWVYLCTLNGDADYRKSEDLPANAPLPAPDWARGLFVLAIGGLLFVCLGLPIATMIAEGNIP